MAKTFAVAGKGGTGKTTIAALIVRHLIQRNAGPVLAMDADPDANLGTLLGVKPEQSVGDLREELLKNIKSLPAGMSKQAYMEAGLHQIVAESRGFDLISMGRGEGPGCYCYLNSLIRKFSEDLAPSYAWVVMDNEAGLEHLSRRTAYSIDTLFVVVNESPLSHDTARRIGSVLGAIKNNVRTTRLITNMVRPERLAEVRQRLAAIGMEYAGDVPRDPALEDAVLAGCTVLSLEQSPAIDSVNHIMETL
jgi:CO dehydrogenase maturation factor